MGPRQASKEQGPGFAAKQAQSTQSAERLEELTHCTWEEPKPVRCRVPTLSSTPLGTTRQPDTSLGPSAQATQPGGALAA